MIHQYLVEYIKSKNLTLKYNAFMDWNGTRLGK